MLTPTPARFFFARIVHLAALRAALPPGDGPSAALRAASGSSAGGTGLGRPPGGLLPLELPCYCLTRAPAPVSRYHAISASLGDQGTWWRGTRDGGLSPNAHGIVWLAPDRGTALSYGPRVLEVGLSPSASVVDLRDLSDPLVRKLKETASASREATVGHPISDDAWPLWADFGVLEANGWAVPLLLEGMADGVLVSDYRGTAAVVPHESLALINPSAISSQVEVAVD